MLILAIDLGTTGNRAIVFDHETRAVAKSYREFRQLFPQPGWVEHDPEEIWQTTRAVIAEALAKVDADQIAAVGVTNQRETIVCWDPKTGQPLYNAIVWQDRRTAARCAEMRRDGSATEIHQRTGLVCDPYFSATKIEWLLQNVPITRSGVFGTIDSWIVWKLTGGRVHATDASNASRTMLFNLRERRWDDELLKHFGVSREALPEVRPSSGEFGMMDPNLFGFSAGICGVAGDQQSAMFAQGCYEPGIIKNTYGTGLFLMMNTGGQPHVSDQLLSRGVKILVWLPRGRLNATCDGGQVIDDWHGTPFRFGKVVRISRPSRRDTNCCDHDATGESAQPCLELRQAA